MRFSATILAAGSGGHAIVVPPQVVAELTRPRPPVVARVAGAECRTRLATYSGKTYLGLRQAFLRQIGAAVGDEVEIELTEDVAEPASEAPPVVLTAELDAALTGEIRRAWEALTDDQRHEYLRWTSAVDGAARADRVARTVRRLSR